MRLACEAQESLLAPLKAEPEMMSRIYRLLGRINQQVNRLERLRERQRLASRPVNVDLVVTKACNFACVFCKDYVTPDGSPRVSLANVRTVAEQLFPYARRLNICSGGEPYLHPRLEDILRLAKRYGLVTWVLSNGSIMNEIRTRTMVSEDLIDEHGFSIDGYYPETVQAIRIHADVGGIIRNIEMLQRIKREENKTRPKIIIRYALMRTNIEELPLAVKRWGEMGIDEIQAAYVSLANDMDKDLSLFYHQDLLEEYFNKAREAAEEYPALKVRLPDLIKEDRQIQTPQMCKAPWSFVMIDANGDVLPCYRAFEALRLGNLFRPGAGSFSRIWNSKPYRELRRTVNNDRVKKYYPYCRECENRHRWGSENAHRGDKHWMEVLGEDWLSEAIDHRRPAQGGSATRNS